MRLTRLNRLRLLSCAYLSLTSERACVPVYCSNRLRSLCHAPIPDLENLCPGGLLLLICNQVRETLTVEKLEHEASQASEVTRRTAIEEGIAEKMEQHHVLRAAQREQARVELGVKAKAQVRVFGKTRLFIIS